MFNSEYFEYCEEDSETGEMKYTEYFEDEIKEDKQFTQKGDVHDQTEKFKYPCDLCGYEATQQSNLKRHIESVHQKIKYPCNICEYQATTQTSLKTHVKSVHEKVSY